jgi:hypothetical protein
MLSSIEFKGYFWLPTNPEKRLPGLLKFDPENAIEVELWGQFHNYTNPSSMDNNILLGISSDGKKITMLNCFEHSRGMSIPGFPVSAFSAIYMFVGEHFKSIEELQFKQAVVEYEDANLWLGISGFDNPEYDSLSKEVRLKYKQPEQIVTRIDEHWMAKIEFNFHSPMKNLKPTARASIEQKPLFVFVPLLEQTFKDFQNIYSTFSSFLALCYFTFPVIKSIFFHIHNPMRDEEFEPDVFEIQLYYASQYQHATYKIHKNRQDFLLRYNDINFGEILEKWFLLNTKIEATIDILTENLMKRNMTPTEFTFLGYVQALENMHRQLRGTKISLKERLDEIVAALPVNIAESLLQNEIDFTNRIKNHRNYFTHYSSNSNGYAKASMNELFILSEKMKIILITSILKELDLSDNDIEQIIIGKGIFLFNHLIKVEDVKDWVK